MGQGAFISNLVWCVLNASYRAFTPAGMTRQNDAQVEQNRAEHWLGKGSWTDFLINISGWTLFSASWKMFSRRLVYWLPKFLTLTFWALIKCFFRFLFIYLPWVKLLPCDLSKIHHLLVRANFQMILFMFLIGYNVTELNARPSALTHSVERLVRFSHGCTAKGRHIVTLVWVRVLPFTQTRRVLCLLLHLREKERDAAHSRHMRHAWFHFKMVYLNFESKNVHRKSTFMIRVMWRIGWATPSRGESGCLVTC